MKTSMNKRHQSGFSLLELLLVVAVGAVLILAGLGAYRLVNENNQTNQATRLLATLKQQIQQAYQGQSTYGTGSLIGNLQSMHALPSDLGIAGTGATATAKGPFGPILITGATNNFTIQFDNVPKGACVRLAQQFTPANANDFVSVKVATTTVSQTSAATTYTQAAFMTACQEASAANTMIWTFQ